MPGDRVWALAHDKTRIPNSKKSGYLVVLF